MVKASGPAYRRSWLGKTSADTFLIIARPNSAKTPIHLEHGLTCRGRGIESLLVQEQIDAKRVQLGPNKVLEAAARGAPGSVSSEGQRRTLARQMKRWRASLNPSRSPGTVGEKARCTERCAGCSCARGSAAGCAYRRPGWPTLAAGAWPKPATSWLGNCA